MTQATVPSIGQLDCPTVRLQGVGRWAAKPAKDFAVGDFAVWNAGFTSELLSAEPKGRTQVAWTIRTRDGKAWKRVLKADRLVAFTDGHMR